MVYNIMTVPQYSYRDIPLVSFPLQSVVNCGVGGGSDNSGG